MEPLLFLAHRLPFPPNKGDKVRSYHFLKHLATRYRIFLGAFIDDPADRKHVETLRELCDQICIEGILPWSQRARSTASLLRGEALTLSYFRSRRLHQWVKEIVKEQRIARSFAFSSPMAQYALDLPQVRCFVDMVDMDSAKWAQYASRHPWPVSALYRREARRLLAYEREIASRAEASIFVTDDEANLFCSAAPECAPRVVRIGNGVDSDYFRPSGQSASPYPATERPIVFTGAMDYWPNVDAVSWFAQEMLPGVRKLHPSARFYIVGMNPDAAVRKLADDPAVAVTGRVDDVRPYLEHASVVVAPLRVARGIQNKVLEAMAMAKSVVVTPAMATGIGARVGVEIETAADAPEYVAKVGALMDSERAKRMGVEARARILQDYAWSASYARLDALLEGGGPVQQTAAHIAPREAPYTIAAN